MNKFDESFKSRKGRKTIVLPVLIAIGFLQLCFQVSPNESKALVESVDKEAFGFKDKGLFSANFVAGSVGTTNGYLEPSELISTELVDVREEESEEILEEPLKPIQEDFQVTFYNVSGITYTGVQTEEGITAAVDPAVIPLNSWMRITFPYGTEHVRKAVDTGPAVKGNVVDIYVPKPRKDLLIMGRVRGVKVEII